MSVKLLIKNLNVKEIERNLIKEYDDVNLNINVNDLIETIAKEFHIDSYKFELICRSEIMDRSRSLNDYFNDSNEVSVILVEHKESVSKVADIVKPSEKDVHDLSHRIGATFKSKKKRRQLESFLNNQEIFRIISNMIPTLKQDPICYSFMQSHDLILQLSCLNRAKSLIEEYPNIYHSVKQLYKLFSEEIKNNTINPNFVSKGQFSIDDMSDEEESAQASSGSLRRTTSSGPSISQDHLSAVLAAINQQQQQQPQRAPATSNNFNRDYFENVMQQVLNQSLSNAPRTATAAATTSRMASSQPSQLVSQTSQQHNISDEQLAACLEQMHTLGFWDDERNVKALSITDGNIEAAVSLIIEGVDF